MKPIGLIDGDALRKEYLLAGKNKLSLATVINRLEMMPTLYPVDAVTVVRCKDCYKLYPDGNGGMLNYCRVHHVFVNVNDFCSYGARKDDENETD